MKKFYLTIPFQQHELKKYVYTAVDNSKLQLNQETAFPILAAVNGYVSLGEEFQVIVLYEDSAIGRENTEVFKKQLADICYSRGLIYPTINGIVIPNSSGVNDQLDVFCRTLAFANDEDELFACITYGKKPLTEALLTAVKYAYRVKKNTTIKCIVYGEIDRPKDADWTARIYDETAMVQMDEIVDTLAARNIKNPETVISMLVNV